MQLLRMFWQSTKINCVSPDLVITFQPYSDLTKSPQQKNAILQES